MSQEGPGLYAAAALKARDIVDHPVTASHERCGHDANLHIVHFLQEIRAEWIRRKRDQVKTSSMGRAATSVREFPQRIYNAAMLESLPSIGPETRRMVVEHLWTLPGCAPGPPSAEELQLETQRQAAAVADRKRKAAAAKAAKQALQGQQEQVAHNALHVAPAPAEEARLKKKARKHKEYIPGVGTAAYAFLITLFKAHRHGEDHLTRKDLSDRAEASGLADAPIFGNGQAQGGVNNPQRWYNGWSSFSTLKNREPPLVLAYSLPMKCKLTPEGTILAARLYKDAVIRNRIAEDPAIPLASLPDSSTVAAPSAAATQDMREQQHSALQRPSRAAGQRRQALRSSRCRSRRAGPPGPAKGAAAAPQGARQQPPALPRRRPRRARPAAEP
ncbi:hypothetical protein COCSUDRAFT_83466 [Coccomyxa subellipsoidea C-169]|uniref:Crossover junction endonuclease MUS81 n=1 Tax=Coccomyxa subellipsoidea (strain C-169) TaxID=574566 RepID=I0YVU0_COCSC|nr:hypothetical protein COCSUDRAFT_83466 [Coccomyxa subellipsoidea C-169]EIE22509.1 hypothetical protein COCSUDRAFT_83466 [Coccomyxa subellipsoidea C-169]|eukprot:XP_005647053.1 hypothetical protein COCSUDRAFT_83466 [Coccomyxa subellipsoidea C-169]